MTKIGQFNVGTKKTVWTWLCPSCKEQLEEQVAKPIDYLDSPEQVAAATITLKEEEQKQQPPPQQEQEALTAA